MGACCSNDVTPDIPQVIQPDPKAGEHINAAVVMLGSWGSRDYGIYKGSSVPDSKEDKTEKMWMWFNKENDANDPRLGVVDLENFDRPAEEPKGKGKTIWSAKFAERPRYEMDRYFQGGQRKQRFFGYGIFAMGGSMGYESDDDDHYFNHTFCSRHQSSWGRRNAQAWEDYRILQNPVGWKEERATGPKVMTKYKLETQAVITPGTAPGGRSGTYILECFAKGTAITTWEETTSVRERSVGEDRTEKYISREIEGHDEKFVDRIELTLKTNGEVVDQWVIIGDSSYDRCNATVINECTPFYNSTVNGGFFKRSSSAIETKGDKVDPALSLTIAHLVSTEFSLQEIKDDLNLHTTSHVPRHESELRC